MSKLALKPCWVIVRTEYHDDSELQGMKEELAMFLEGLGLPSYDGQVWKRPPWGFGKRNNGGT